MTESAESSSQSDCKTGPKADPEADGAWSYEADRRADCKTLGRATPAGHTDQRFPRTARLTTTDEFSSVFRLRPIRRSAHLVVYLRHTGGAARLGVVVGRKFARHAVRRNLIKRLAREAFRVRRDALLGWDILFRVHSRFDAGSAAANAVRLGCRDEFAALFAHVDRHVSSAAARPAPGAGRPAASVDAAR